MIVPSQPPSRHSVPDTVRRALIQLLRLETSARWLGRLLPEQDLRATLRQHFAQRFTPEQRQRLREQLPRVYVAVKHHNWEQAGLIDSWAEIAETLPWDWGECYDQHAPDWYAKGKPAFNEALYRRVAQAHAERPLTHFFGYLSGHWVYPETIRRIGKLGIVALNFGFDDSHRFWGRHRHGQWTGNAGIARAFDLNLTAQDPADVAKFRLLGARVLYLPPGGNPRAFADLPQVEKRYFVSFIGKCYGIRKRYIDHLRRHGIDVHVRGEGWPEGPVSHEEMLEIYAASHVILGFGFTGNSRRKTAVKGRDFEIPLTGTPYLTSWNPLLAQHFREGEEILYYRDRSDLVRILHQWRDYPETLASIGQAGQRRARAEHDWAQRWHQVLDRLQQSLDGHKA